MNDVKYEYGCEVTKVEECPLREEIRNKTIEEFVKRIEKNQTHHDSPTLPIEFDMSVDMTDILEIAEQMKGKNE